EGIVLHWYPAGQGINPNAGNRVDFTLHADGLSFVTPPGQAGWRYQISLLRESSGERIDSPAEQWLTVVDDTAPRVRVVRPLDAVNPLIVEAGSTLVADGFRVIKEFKDYESRPQP